MTRANGQTITYNTFDAMNRVTQQTATQSPEPAAVTLYTYYPSGLLQTMQDPHLVGVHSADSYSYTYDSMGRKQSVTYPAPDVNSPHRVEYFSYDTAGRLSTFQNRMAAVQTFSYDERNRMTGFTWSDGTPNVTFGYDVGSRLTTITNVNATISRSYFNDNLLSSETTTYADNTARTVSYTYDADSNRATLQYPANAYSFTYSYTGRDQLKTIVDNNSATIATYWYDLDGNMTRRTPNNGTSSVYTYDTLDRVLTITHSLASGDRTLVYGYDAVGNRSWVEREGAIGDAFAYDLNDQMTAGKLNISSPDVPGAAGNQTISYDANGNRVAFGAYGSTDTYTTNNLNQYSYRNLTQAAYDPDGNITTGLDGSTYTYDAQNRLLTARKGTASETVAYDGLNRQVSRIIGTGMPTYNVYDGWNLIGEYAGGATTPTAAYVSGTGGLIKNLTSNNYYYQAGSGSTSHLASASGALLEWYRYDLQGTPLFYNASNTQISASAYGIRHLFTGQQWYSELGLYDLRNRYYSPDIGRFLQPDPIGFIGDATNLYRYCRNSPMKTSDPTGLLEDQYISEKGNDYTYGGYAEVERVVVTDSPIYENPPDFPGFSILPGGQIGTSPWRLPDASEDGGGTGFGLHPREIKLGSPLPPSPSLLKNALPSQNPPPQNPPSQNPAPPPNLSVLQRLNTTAMAASTTIVGIAVYIVVKEYTDVNSAESMVAPGETAYLKDPLSELLTGLFDENVFLQISRDQNGQIHTQYVYPGGG